MAQSNEELSKTLGAYKLILAAMVESLLEYGKGHKGTVEGLMAYDVLSTAQEQADAWDINLADMGLTEDVVKSLL